MNSNNSFSWGENKTNFEDLWRSNYVEPCEPIFKRSQMLPGKKEIETQYLVLEIEISDNLLD